MSKGDTETVTITARKLGRPFNSFQGSTLSREIAVSTALIIVTDKGLSGLTIQSLAKTLALSRAPIYKLFSSRQALIEAVIDAVLEKIYLDHNADFKDWRDELRQLALNTFKTYRAYPGITSELISTGFPDTEVGKRTARLLARIMRKAGAQKQIIPTLILTISAMITGAEMEFSGQKKREAKGNTTLGTTKKLAERRGDTLPGELLNTDTFKDAVEVILLGIEARIAQQS